MWQPQIFQICMDVPGYWESRDFIVPVGRLHLLLYFLYLLASILALSPLAHAIFTHHLHAFPEKFSDHKFEDL